MRLSGCFVLIGTSRENCAKTPKCLWPIASGRLFEVALSWVAPSLLDPKHSMPSLLTPALPSPSELAPLHAPICFLKKDLRSDHRHWRLCMSPLPPQYLSIIDHPSCPYTTACGPIPLSVAPYHCLWPHTIACGPIYHCLWPHIPLPVAPYHRLWPHTIAYGQSECD